MQSIVLHGAAFLSSLAFFYLFFTGAVVPGVRVMIENKKKALNVSAIAAGLALLGIHFLFFK